MLQRLSPRIRYCLDDAAEAQRRAADSSGGQQGIDHLLLAAGWNTLARSEDFRDRLERFLTSQRDAGEISPRAEPSTLGSNGDRDTLNSEKRLIAIVEDDAEVRDALLRLLCTLGYTASAFGAAEEYLFSHLMRDTACLISDVRLPGMSGPDLQARLIADGYRIPIIFVSAFFDEGVQTRVLKAGAVSYLGKPCNPKVLIECIERALTTAS